MNAKRRILCGILSTILTVPALGCGAEPPDEPAKKPAQAPDAKRAEFGKNVWLETRGSERRVILESRVCLREGMLELLLCRQQTKEHESILSAEIDARMVHAALLAAGALPGAPVRYQPDFKPASGTRIRVTLEYKDRGKTVTIPAQRWVLNSATKKELAHDWVFAGSQFVPSLEDKDKTYYLAQATGDVICISNFDSAMLDLPINSPKDNNELAFEAHTELIPPLETKVTVILELVLEPKKPVK